MNTPMLSRWGSLVLPVGASLASAAYGQAKNVVYIMCDDLAYQAVSAYDSSRMHTPNIDRIARDGMLFNRCYVTNSLSGPSRACLLTGKYSHKNGFYDNNSTFNAAQQTFPKLLRAAGYQTAVIGKWHLVTDPTGFDYWDIHNGQGTYYNPQMFQGNATGRLLNRTVTGYATRITDSLAIYWMTRLRDTTKPFVLLVHFKAPHRNWQPWTTKYQAYQSLSFVEPSTLSLFDDYSCRGTPALLQDMTIKRTLTQDDLKFTGAPAGSNTAAWNTVYNARIADYNSRGWTWTSTTPPAQISWKYQCYMRDYLACISSVDDEVGRLLDTLKAKHLDSTTVVIMTSDQGFYMGEHGWFDKRFMYEESFRTPLCIKYPGVITPGSKNNDLVANLDFAETILDIAGVTVPSDMQGRSFLPILQGSRPADWRKYFYYHYYEQILNTHNVYRHYGVTDGRHKLMYFWDIAEWEYYDLKKDPHELINQYYIPQNDSIINVLKLALDSLRHALGDSLDTIVTRTKATFTTCPAPIGIHLIVNNGSGSGYYAAGDTVWAVAAQPPVGQYFYRWTGDTASVSSAGSSTTMVIVPGADITITATYSSTGIADGRPFLVLPVYFNLRVSARMLQYQLPPSPTGSPALVRITVYDLNGKAVSTLVSGMRKPGYYCVAVEPGSLAAGVYYIAMTAPEYSKVIPYMAY